MQPYFALCHGDWKSQTSAVNRGQVWGSYRLSPPMRRLQCPAYARIELVQPVLVGLGPRLPTQLLLLLRQDARAAPANG